MVSAQSLAEYKLTFDATWSPQTHPDRFPTGRNPHFTSLIGGTHNESVTFWEVGGTATSGIESMAETGSTGGFSREVEAAISRQSAKTVLRGPSISSSPNNASMTFDIDSRWSLVTLTSMLAPSPDWFIGVSGLNLLDEKGEWLPKMEVELFAYDAGSEDGDNYSLSNPDTQPKEKIRRIEKAPFVVNGKTRSVGTFVFELQSTKSINVSNKTLSILEGQSKSVNVTLSSPPSGSVTVNLSSSHPDQISVSPTEITFTSSNYNSNMPVTISAKVDDDSNNLTGASIALSSSGGGYDELSTQITINVDNIDLDDPSIEIDPEMISVTEGEKETFTVLLSEKPISDVTVRVSMFANSDFTRSPESLTFTPSDFDQGQKIEITLSEDNDAETDSDQLTLTANDGGYDGVSLDVQIAGVEDDLPDAMIRVKPSFLNVPPGGSRIFLVALSRQPTSDVTVRLSKLTTPGLTYSYETIVFTPFNFEVGQLIIVRASDDSNESGTETLVLRADGGGFDNALANVDISVKIMSVPNLSLNIVPNPVKEGEIANIVLSLSEEVDKDVIVPLIITNETSESEDYEVTHTEFLIYRNPELSATVRLLTKEDDDQDNETLTISLGDLPEIIADVKKPDPVLVTIEDNDIGAPTALFIHNSQGDVVDVYLDEEKLIEGFSFQQTRKVNLKTTEIRFDIVNANSVDTNNPLHTYTFSPKPGTEYQMIIQRSSEDKLSVIDLNNDERGDSGNNVTIRAIHGAPDLGDVTLRVFDATSSSTIDSPLEMRFGSHSRAFSLDRKLINIAVSQSSTSQEIQVYKLDLSQSPEEIQGFFLLSGKGKTIAEGFSPFGVWSSGEKFMPLITTNAEELPILDFEDVTVGHYPNPFVDHANLWFNLPEASEIDIQVVDIIGRTAFSTVIPNSRGADQFHEIDTSGWPAGVYLYRVIITSQSGQSVSTGKMTKLQ